MAPEPLRRHTVETIRIDRVHRRRSWICTVEELKRQPELLEAAAHGRETEVPAQHRTPAVRPRHVPRAVLPPRHQIEVVADEPDRLHAHEPVRSRSGTVLRPALLTAEAAETRRPFLQPRFKAAFFRTNLAGTPLSNPPHLMRTRPSERATGKLHAAGEHHRNEHERAEPSHVDLPFQWPLRNYQPTKLASLPEGRAELADLRRGGAPLPLSGHAPEAVGPPPDA